MPTDADSPDDAVRKCVFSMSSSDWPGVGPKSIESLLEGLRQDEGLCVPVDAYINMWCTTCLARGKFFVFHVIKTVA
ncbi:hypothetical protein BVX94_02020 [bacterium B17]|nr:hypothetical protein BVX94_02020 [bacterium B17]